MLSSILKKVRQQLVLMLAVALLLVATYVGAGHLFMPAVSGYVSFFEEQVLERSGISIVWNRWSVSFKVSLPSST